jgi:transitional endoplasmic reticulum ATPase
LKEAAAKVRPSISPEQLAKYRSFAGDTGTASPAEGIKTVKRDHGTGFHDIPGMDSLKQMLAEEVIDPLQNPAKYKKYGIGIPNGVLLYGPPGCGKTFIVTALASELGYNYFQISAGEMGSKFAHETSNRIRDAFQTATLNAPSIIFIDEIDSLVASRTSSDESWIAEEVNEFLLQLNSCASRGVLVVAATNLPWKVDPAAMRTGRLDRHIYVGPPDLRARTQIVQFYLKERPTDPGLDLSKVAGHLNGYSSSDLRVLVESAARIAMRESADIGAEHLLGAASRVPPSVGPEQEAPYKAFLKARQS